MRRYWLERDLSEQEILNIEGDLFHHIFMVCKNKKGSQFELIHSKEAHLVEVLQVDKKTAQVLCLEKRKLPQLKRPHLYLALSHPKPAVFDAVLEKAVELGIKGIVPLVSENSFFKSKEKIEKRLKRLGKIKRQALQQSGRGEDLIIEELLDLEGLLGKVEKENACIYFFYEDGSGALSLKKEESFAEKIYLLVGPEGGFSSEESEKVLSSKASRQVYLGDQILRVETACVAGASILKFAYNLW